MTPPDLTPEQMNDAVRLADEEWRRWPYRASSDRVKALSAAITRALPVLFAAWQEQTAAKAGENPYVIDGMPRLSAQYAREHEAWARGAAAGVAASEARVREAAEALRLLSDPDDPPFADWSFIDPAEAREEAMQAFARSALAALLSEEPGGG